MKKLLITMTMLAAVTAPVFAALNVPMRVEVPYEFVVNGKTLPAGTYRITESHGSAVVVVRGKNAQSTAMALGSTAPVRSEQDSIVTFALIDGKHYLVNVTHDGVSKDLRATQTEGSGAPLAVLKAVR